MHPFQTSEIQLFTYNLVKLFVQGALVGSYKGSCHLYNTSGTVRGFFFSLYNNCVYLSILYSDNCGHWLTSCFYILFRK